MRQLLVSVRSDFQSPIVKSCDTTRVPGRRLRIFGRSFRLMLGSRYIVSTVAGERSVSNRFCCRNVTRSVTPARLALSCGIPDPGGIEIDAERPRAEPARGDGDAAVARPEVDHVIRGADLGDLEHAIHGLPRGRNVDDVQTLCALT